MIALNYGSQLQRAYRNLAQSRSLTKNLGKEPRDMWITLETSGGSFSGTGFAPGGLNYYVNSDLSMGSMTYAATALSRIQGRVT